jgi:hypothetical protein
MSNTGHEITCMSCHQIEPHIVDLARGVNSDQDAQLARHVLGCPSCAGRLEQERAMSAALRRVANDLKDPADDPQREQALLAIFDRDWHRSDRHAPVWTRVAAAGLVFAAALMWHLAGPPRSPRTGTPPIAAGAPETKQAQALDAASLITPDSRERPAPGPSTPPSTPVHSPGARHADLRLDEAPDSTEFVAWPGATAWPPFESGELIRIDIPTEVGAVQAEVLVGQDGFPRAIRLVQ